MKSPGTVPPPIEAFRHRNGMIQPSSEDNDPYSGLVAVPVPLSATTSTSNYEGLNIDSGGGEEKEQVAAAAMMIARVDDDKNERRNAIIRYEILPGLFAQMADDAIVTLHDIGSNFDSDGGDDHHHACHDDDNREQGDKEYHQALRIRAEKVSLGFVSSSPNKDKDKDGDGDGNNDGYQNFLTAHDVILNGQLVKRKHEDEGRKDKKTWGNTVLYNLDIAAKGGLALDPSQDQKKVEDFLATFGCSVLDGAKGNTADNSKHPSENASGRFSKKPSAPPPPTRRLNREEWESFLKNAREDKKVVKDEDFSIHQATGEQSPPLSSPVADFMIPSVHVHPITLKLMDDDDEGTIALIVPECQGNANCTIRTLVEYYCQSILQSMSGGDCTNNAYNLLSSSSKNADSNGASRDPSSSAASMAMSDVASVKGSLIGAAAGACILGPVGLLAGSYFGGQMGRKHSSSMVGAVAGSALFGPVGLVAGACYGESVRSTPGGGTTTTMVASDGGENDTVAELGPEEGEGQEEETEHNNKNIAEMAAKHFSSNKGEYAGTTGVAAGAAAGSVLGPLGMVAGAVIGSVSARKVVESVENKDSSSSSSSYASTDNNETSNYRFGDITRSIVARGKQSRASEGKEEYRFGDFTRGLFNRGKAN